MFLRLRWPDAVRFFLSDDSAERPVLIHRGHLCNGRRDLGEPRIEPGGDTFIVMAGEGPP